MEPIDLSAILPHLRRTPAFERVRALSAGRILTLGVGDAAKPAALAAIAGQREGPVVVITTRADRAEALAEELSVWLGADAEVLLYPERDALPYERLAAAPDIVRDRLRAAAALSTGERCIIVASALAIAQRTLAPGAAVGSIRRLSKGDRLEMDAFLGELAALGYSIEPVVAEAGQASRRGGIIDVSPPGAELPVRIELLGREIESLRAFDPSTQRSIGPVETIEIGPARELVAPDLSRLRNLDFGRTTRAARERFEEDLANLEADSAFEGRDFYVPLLAQATLLDHQPEDSLLVLDERADIAAVLDEALEEAETARGELEERGEVPHGLPCALERWHALEK